MISLERLLDGLDVEVEAMAVDDRCGDHGRPHCQADGVPDHGGSAAAVVLRFDGGATIQISRRRLVVLPAQWRTRPDLDRSSSSVRIRATCHRSVNLFDQLRQPIVEQVSADDPMRRAVQELMDEIAGRRPGFRTMAEILVKRFLILLLRRSFGHGYCPASWLAALDDTRLGRAVSAMQERPGHSFTLLELAELAGMSRSVFAARFVDILAQPPMVFLKTVRLSRAAELLTSTDMPVKAVAAQVGYSSRSSFTRAFFARHGLAPAAFRLTHPSAAGDMEVA